MGQLGASCFHTLTDDEREISLPEWEEERFGMMCAKASDFASWKATLQKLCSLTKRCTYEEKKMILDFDNKVNAYIKRVNDEQVHP